MSDPKSHDIQEIETLLANRQRLVEWLDRLDAAGTRAPSTVRAKVRGDYQARLGQVVAQLSTHRDVIASTLDGLRSQSNEIEQLRQEETDIRAEAELRHAVGEYTDDEWQLVELESAGKIAGFDHEIARLGGEIRRLEEVLALIVPAESRQSTSAPGPAPVPTPAPSTEPAAVPEGRPALTLERVEEEAPPPAPQPRPEAPRFVPRGGHFPREPIIPARSPRAAAASAPAGAGVPGNREDELAFLRSMNVEIMSPSPRTSGGSAGGTTEAEPRAATPVPKTLKCGDCGSLNRPTDWYCERCGAELAAV